MLYETHRYKVSNMEETISIYVTATNPIDALDQVKKMTDCNDFKIAQRIDE
jgi:hypothetical protein